MIGVASGQYAAFDGYCAARNVEPLQLPLDRALNLIYFWFTEHMDSEGKQRFDMQLSMPPAGVEPTTGPWSAEEMGGGFMALAAMQGKTAAPA